MSAFLESLRRHLGPDYPLNEWQGARLEAHYALLMKWNQRINLTAVRDVEELVVHHYCESIALGSILPFGKLRVMDVGSGAGFPGIPFAIARPDCTVLLVESDGRKAVFLKEATLELTNCLVIRARLGQVQQCADWMICRAVRWEDVIEEVHGRADHLALLVSSCTASEAHRLAELHWEEDIRLPWGERRVVLIGHVSRGTLK
jgi:16S rRNA (guanine527-N7)-methyltransferase